MSTDAVVLRWCTTCLTETMFEQPDCADGHEGDCPEWVCVTCGDALLLGFAPPAAVRASGRSSHVA